MNRIVAAYTSLFSNYANTTGRMSQLLVRRAGAHSRLDSFRDGRWCALSDRTNPWDLPATYAVSNPGCNRPSAARYRKRCCIFAAVFCPCIRRDNSFRFSVPGRNERNEPLWAAR